MSEGAPMTRGRAAARPVRRQRSNPFRDEAVEGDRPRRRPGADRASPSLQLRPSHADPLAGGLGRGRTRSRAAEELRGLAARRRRGGAPDWAAAGDRRGAALVRRPQGLRAGAVIPAPGRLRPRARAPDRAAAGGTALHRDRPARRGRGDGRRRSQATAPRPGPGDRCRRAGTRAGPGGRTRAGHLAQRGHPDRRALAWLHAAALQLALPHRRAAGDRRRGDPQGGPPAPPGSAGGAAQPIRRRHRDLVRLDARLPGADPAGRARQRALALCRLPRRPGRDGARPDLAEASPPEVLPYATHARRFTGFWRRLPGCGQRLPRQGLLAGRFPEEVGLSEDAYAKAGVSQGDADSAVASLVSALSSAPPAQSRQVLASGHYANVVRLDERTGIALSADGVGTKLVLAEQLGRWDTVGIDCVAMNVNDVVCVGAEPLAMVDYLAVERADAEIAGAIGVGLARGAELAGIEIVGGELAQLGEIVNGLDLAGACFGVVSLDALVTGAAIEPGDALIGLPSSGLHSNGYTLARSVLSGIGLEDERLGRPLGELLLEPTEIYVKPVVELLRSSVDVRGLAHITSGGLGNLLRLEAEVAYEVDDPLPVPPVFSLIQELGEVSDGEMGEVFNMGCGFCVVVAAADEAPALEMLRTHYPGASRIGRAEQGPPEIRRAA